MAYIDVKHVSKIYGSGEQEVRANDDINFEIAKGELTIIVGASAPANPHCSTFWVVWTHQLMARSL